MRVEFKLAKEVYKNNIVDEELLKKRIIDLAYNNPGLTFYFNNEKFIYKKGLFQLAERIDEGHAFDIGQTSYVYESLNSKKKKVKGKIDISVSLTIHPASEERESLYLLLTQLPRLMEVFITIE